MSRQLRFPYTFTYALITILTLGICAILFSDEGRSEPTAEVKGRQVDLLNLNEEEREYLRQKKAVTMCIDPDWMPYERIDENGRHEGMSADYMAIFEQRIGVPIQLISTTSWSESTDFAKARKCDILSMLNKSPERRQYLNFTDPYIESQSVLVTRDDVTYLDGLKAVGTRSLSTPKGYVFEEQIRKNYPKTNLVTVPTVRDGLLKVSNGEIFAHLGSIFIVVNEIQKNQLSNLKISGHTEYEMKFRVGIRNDVPILLSVFSKAVNSLTEEEHIRIQRKWTATKFEHGMDYSLIWKITFAALLLLFVVLLWNRKLVRVNARIKKSEERFRKVFEISPALVSISTVDTATFLDVNEVWLRTLGYEKSEVIGKSLFNLNILIDTDSRSQAVQRIDQSRHTNVETQFKTKDGEIRDFLVSGEHIEFEGQDCYLFISQDITESKRAEEGLRRREEQFSKLFDSSPALTSISSLEDGVIIDVNEKWLSTLGFKKKEVVGRTTEDLGIIAGFDMETRSRQIELVRKTGRSNQFESTLKTKSGKTLSFLATVEIIHFDDDEYLLAVSQDITERKNTEQQLIKVNRALKTLSSCTDAVAHAESEEHLLSEVCRIAVEVGGYCLAWVGYRENDVEKSVRPVAMFGDYSGYVENAKVSWSDKTERGRGPGGLSIRTQKPSIVRFTEDNTTFAPWQKAALELGFASMISLPLSDENACCGNFNLYAPEADAFDKEELKLLLDLSSNLSYGILSLREQNIRKMIEDDLKESEAYFRGIFKNSGIGMTITTPDGKFREVNPALCEILGYSEKELLAKSIKDVTHPDDIASTDRRRGDLIANDEETQDIEKRLINKNGDIVWILLNRAVVRNETDEIIYIIGQIQDITNRKVAEDQLRQAQKMEAVGQLTGGVAHDFNNLLQVMLGNNELLEDEIGDDESAHSLLEAVKMAVTRASSLTSRLLAFSRQQTLSPVASDISHLIGGLEDMLRRTLGETIDLKVVYTADLWFAMIDPAQLDHALVNLAVNARDAMPKGGTLTIETTNVTLDETYVEQYEEVTPGDYVGVAVSDTGTGMTPEVLGKVFEPFFTTKDVGKGSGLGLSMVYGFVKQSKGHITINSEVDHGTIIKLYLPRSQNAVAQADSKDDTPEFEMGSERILVIEDDEHVRKVLVRILLNQGYEVAEAKDGVEAISHLKNDQPFDLLFTDVVLPGGMNGVEIAAQVKRIQPDIKVLYTSGYTENAIVHDGRIDPGIRLVNKPYHRAELLEKVRETLESESG